MIILNVRSLICSPFTVQDVLDAGLGDDGVVTFEPLVLVLPDEGGVVAALKRPLVVHHCEQTVPDEGSERNKLNPGCIYTASAKAAKSSWLHFASSKR